ncbi:MAG TPA: hypothetical protein VFG04_03835 [Planctomycetaceae bacterium]|jgi:hypothetical protein|nr:hypothetical protein [Planctomycetaceae bacterium]
MELKILIATEVEGEPWKGKVITIDLEPEGLPSAEDLVGKLLDYGVANIHQIDGVRSHAVSSEMLEEEPKEFTCRIETTINLLLNRKEANGT